jgi:GNAT superfamily N-acetyltransferase
MVCSIVKIPRDEDGIRSYVGRYKQFRLDALRLSPEAFASTYAREAEFSDQIWYDRLANPRAATFLAYQEDTSTTIGTVTVLGPLPIGVDELMPLGNPWVLASGEDANKLPTTAHFRINGMFTLPEMRGRGVGKTLLQEALKYAANEAVALGREFLGSIVVGSDNEPARRLYEKCGFVAIKEELHGDGDATAILMKLSG